METQTVEKKDERKLVAYRKRTESGIPISGVFIVVGQPKSGKTTFSASFPDSYVLELEKDGAARVDGRIEEINDLATFRQVLPALIKEPSIKTIVVDTLDALSDWLEDEVAKAHGLEAITERKPGVDGYSVWGEYRTKIENLMSYLEACGKLVILTAHCKEAALDNTGNVVVPAGINIPGKSGPYIAGRAKLIGYAYRKQTSTGTAYHLTFQGGPLGNWGSRVDELNDKTLLLQKENPYQAFGDIFKTESIIETEKKLKGGKR